MERGAEAFDEVHCTGSPQPVLSGIVPERLNIHITRLDDLTAHPVAVELHDRSVLADALDALRQERDGPNLSVPGA